MIAFIPEIPLSPPFPKGDVKDIFVSFVKPKWIEDLIEDLDTFFRRHKP
jgi:hypothetical protein